MNQLRVPLLKPALAVILVVVSFLFAFVIVLIAAGLLEVAPGEIPQALIPLFLLAVIGIPLVSAFAISRWLYRRGWWAPWAGKRWPRPVARVLLAAYVLTIAFGMPAVQTHTNSWAVSEYKRLKASGSRRVWEAHPYISTYFAVPILPGVILTYHEYQLDGLYGFGGFQLFAWYGSGVSELWHLPLWLS